MLVHAEHDHPGGDYFGCCKECRVQFLGPKREKLCRKCKESLDARPKQDDPFECARDALGRMKNALDSGKGVLLTENEIKALSLTIISEIW